MDQLYLTGEGIFGLPVLVVATYVFHFVLFGVIATRIGLGQLFIDVAYCVAGRYAGCSFTASYQGNFIADGDSRGPQPPNATWGFCGALEGVLECPCGTVGPAS